jgi:hypothetical protein
MENRKEEKGHRSLQLAKREESKTVQRDPVPAAVCVLVEMHEYVLTAARERGQSRQWARFRNHKHMFVT